MFFRKLFLIGTAALIVLSSAYAGNPGANAGDPLMQWCGNTLRVMEHARQDAGFAYRMGDFAGAKSRLITGLVDAMQTNPFRKNGPLTARAIERGIQLSQVIDGNVSGQQNGNRTLAFFLFQYYDFVARVANDIDFPFYIPFQRCTTCRIVEEAVFEQRYIQFAREQIQMILNALAETVSSRGGYFVFPVGTPSGFLSALELAAAFAAADLRESLWAARYACEVYELNDLAARLHRFNHTGMGFYDDVDAVNRGYAQANAILSELGSGNCGRYRGGMDR